LFCGSDEELWVGDEQSDNDRALVAAVVVSLVQWRLWLHVLVRTLKGAG